jgi:pimeloyl-ACP methyl ester carboxylesterase
MRDDILRGGPEDNESPALPSNSPPNPQKGGRADGPNAKSGRVVSDELRRGNKKRKVTLVFFHGWGANGRVWERQAEFFQDRATVLTPTLPAWEVDWLVDYLGALPLPDCLLVGWSLGGMLLLEALSRRPGPAPGGLVLVGVAPVFTRRPDYPWGQPAALVRAMRRALPTEGQKVLEEFADRCLAPGETAFVFQARAAFTSPAAAGDLAAGLDYLLQRDLRSLLPGLPGGAVIIQGQEDRIVPPEQGRILKESLPGSSLYLMPGAGHLPFLTQAAAFNRRLTECLNTAT